MKEKDISQGLLCFGGSFNPIHYGHLQCLQYIAEHFRISKIFLIPTAQPPHKIGQPDIVESADRLTMCRIAVEGDSRFLVSDIEVRRAGASYTIDTVAELQRQGYRQIMWLIGADMLLYLPKWHRSSELLERITFLIMPRPGVSIDWAALPPLYQGLKENVVDTPLVDISATEIRRRVKAGEPIDTLTPPGVVKYIEERGLFR